MTTSTTDPDLLEDLAPHLSERTRLVGSDATTEADRDVVGDGKRWVLYWMRTAMRGHDNPALDVAVALANAEQLPVLVYQELRNDGPRPYPSDRQHHFVLQGACDVRDELSSRGITCALHVQRGDDSASYLPDLVAEAEAVVVEDLPVYWHRRQTRELANGVRCPVLAVDTSCVVPFELVSGNYARAYRFRKAHRPLLRERLHRRWQAVDPEVEPIAEKQLPFSPVDPRSEDIANIVADCDIDHSVAPVVDTPGGSAAAYTRWRWFRDHRLDGYHRDRNDAASPDSVSRLSAYLHYGQISPFRVARQAAKVGGDGVDKFLDELITWREFAHHVGRSRSGRPDWDWLPDWAHQTLEEHRGDPRSNLYDWETLARGKTEDDLWNLAQKSLLAHGELHNNLRMTWGKQFLRWTADPRRAIELAIDLNDRYALDGADPNSYLGILWCFGAFDRPFSPDREISGSVRPRSSERHAQRLDVDSFRRRVRRPPTEPAPRIAVIGAGVAGLSCGRTLGDHGLSVEVFDKGRGPGGRASTRRSREGYAFDHGAQYFTVRDEVLRRHLEAWQQQGVAAEWTPRVGGVDADEVDLDSSNTTKRYVGVPGNDAICDHLATDLEPRYETEVVELVGDDDGGWRLRFDGSEESAPFDAVVITAPAPQAAALLKSEAPELAAEVASVEFRPTWALMVAFDAPLSIDADALFINDGPLGWIARDTSKPGRRGVDNWVAHATPQWSEEHLDHSAAEVRQLMMDALSSIAGRFGASLPEPEFVRAHRWRFARAAPPLERGVLAAPEGAGLYVCGDWLAGSRIEGAFMSGIATAGRILGRIAVDSSPPQRPPHQLRLTDMD